MPKYPLVSRRADLHQRLHCRQSYSSSYVSENSVLSPRRVPQSDSNLSEECPSRARETLRRDVSDCGNFWFSSPAFRPSPPWEESRKSKLYKNARARLGGRQQYHDAPSDSPQCVRSQKLQTQGIRVDRAHPSRQAEQTTFCPTRRDRIHICSPKRRRRKSRSIFT